LFRVTPDTAENIPLSCFHDEACTSEERQRRSTVVRDMLLLLLLGLPFLIGK
jgi:hypothetical protein